MSVEVLSTPYGPAATELLGETVAGLKDGDPLRMVTVVAPTNIAAIGTRRALGTRQGGLISVGFMKIFDVAERLARPRLISEGGRPMSDAVLATAIRQVLDHEPGVFAAVARHPATEQALARSYVELRDLSGSALGALAGQSSRARQVVRIYHRAREILSGRWIDEFDLIEAAIGALATEQGRAIAAGLGPVVVYLPQQVGNAQGRLVSALSGVTRLTVIAGLSGDDRADGPVRQSLRRMGARSQPRDSPVAASGTRSGASTAPSTPAAKPRGSLPLATGTRLISASDADEEVRAAVRWVVNAARRGVPLARIAVLYGSRQPYAGLLGEHLGSAGIEFNGPSGRTAADSMLGGTLLTLLHLNDRGFRRSDVFSLLTAVAPDGGARRIAAWDRVARRAGVVRGVEQWSGRLGRFASERREAAEDQRADPEGFEWRAERYEREADDADELATFVAGLAADLATEEPDASWQWYCDWARGLIDTYIADDRSRQDWPQAEQDAAEGVLDVLSHLSSLDEIGSRPGGGVFRSTVAQELSASAGRIGRVGQGVMTGPIGHSLGMDLDIVVILGLAEGVFPSQPLDDPLLPDREREAAGGELELRRDLRERWHLDLLSTLASAETGVLVFARGDMTRGAEQHPSRWWLDAAGGLAGHPVAAADLESLEADWLEFVPSFAGGIAGAGFPATSQEFRLQEFEGCGGHQDRLRDHPLIAGDAVLARGVEMSTARASEEFTRFDGNLAGVRSTSPVGEVVSATSLETWAKCPLRYFLRHILHVEPQEQAEQLLEISPLEKGSLVHRILEGFLAAELGDGAVPPPGVPWSPEQRTRLMAIAAEQCAQAEAQGLTGKPAFWFHDRNRILADLRRFLDDDDRRRAERRATPVAGEWSFGMPADEAGPLAVRPAGGGEILFRGRVDRVDRTACGGLIVVDYKTGKVSPEIKKLPKDSGKPHEPHMEDPDADYVQRGTLLQLPVYGRAAQAGRHGGRGAVSVHYWFVSAADGSEVRGFPMTDVVQRRFDEVVATILDGIETGVFCDRPEPGAGRYSTPCDYCNADRLGTGDRRREWERKRGQPELVPYRNLAEPDDAGTEA